VELFLSLGLESPPRPTRGNPCKGVESKSSVLEAAAGGASTSIRIHVHVIERRRHSAIRGTCVERRGAGAEARTRGGGILVIDVEHLAVSLGDCEVFETEARS
jgi:hypothetical protein